MSKTLTQLISVIQANLLDSGTLFSTATCTAAVRQALKEFNQKVGNKQGTLIDAVDEQLDYEVSAADSTAIAISDVLLWDDDGDIHIPLPHDKYMEDARLYFHLKTAQPEGEFLLVRYVIPFIVNGLDSQVESTLPVFWEDILIDGGCFYACQIRSAGRIEAINLNQKVTENWIDTKRYYRKAFDAGLRLAGMNNAAVSEPDQSAWEI